REQMLVEPLIHNHHVDTVMAFGSLSCPNKRQEDAPGVERAGSRPSRRPEGDIRGYSYAALRALNDLLQVGGKLFCKTVVVAMGQDEIVRCEPGIGDSPGHLFRKLTAEPERRPRIRRGLRRCPQVQRALRNDVVKHFCGYLLLAGQNLYQQAKS